MNHLTVYLKWCFLIGINVIVSTIFVSDIMKTSTGAMGVFAGIMTFVFLYARIDIFLRGKGKEKWRKALYIGVVIKSLFQLFPMIDLLTGAMAVDMVTKLFGHDVLMTNSLVFTEIYLTTVIDGLILSVLAAILTLSTRIFYSSALGKKKVRE